MYSNNETSMYYLGFHPGAYTLANDASSWLVGQSQIFYIQRFYQNLYLWWMHY